MFCSLRWWRPGWGSRFKILLSRSVYDLDAHVAGGAGDDADARLVAVGVQVLLLQVVDLEKLLLRDLADLVLVRTGRAARDVGRLLKEDRRRGRLEDER